MRNAAILASALVCALVVQVNLESSLANRGTPKREDPDKFHKHLLESFDNYKLSSFQEDSKNKDMRLFSWSQDPDQSHRSLFPDSLSGIKLNR